MKTANRDASITRALHDDDSISLSRLNLNLLPSLKALLDTKSVTEAAKLLCVTQPTMSRNLAQLRENLCDPVLVRQGSQTTLSEMAKAIHPRVNRLVVEASTIFENANFDPLTTKRHFRLAGNQGAVEHLFPEILCDFRSEAPNFSFEVELLNEHVIEKLHSGEIDLAIGYSGHPPAGLRSQEVFRFRLACLMSREHPLANRPFTIEELSQYPHLIQTSGCSQAPQVQEYYKHLGIAPLVSTPSFTSVQEILVKSDYLCLHAGLTGSLYDQLITRQVPDVAPEVDGRMVWPEYWNANRSHRWLRDRVFQHINRVCEVCGEMVSATGNTGLVAEDYSEAVAL